MHLLTLPEGIENPIPVPGGRIMEGGKSYICSNAFAGAMLQARYRVIIEGEMWALNTLLKVEPFKESPITDFKKPIWLVRGGGFGDLLMMTPVIREIKAIQPDADIHVACGEIYAPVLDGLGVTIELLPIPSETNGTIISFEAIFEGTPFANQVHGAQLFADRLGINLKENYKPDYIVQNVEKLWADESYPRTNRKRIGVQYLASCLIRSYPLINQAIDLLLKRNIEIFIFGEPGQIGLKEDASPLITNLSARNLTFRQSAAVLTTCDCAIAPDSSMVHLAAALDMPCVALYGPHDAQLRVSSDKTIALQGQAPCAPCGFHAVNAMDAPAGMPCSETSKCIAILSIDPRMVVGTALGLSSRIITP